MAKDDERDGFLNRGEYLKQEGMQRVDDNADEDWKLEADRAVLAVAEENLYLTSDDVMERIDPSVQTGELRAMGPVMLRAAKAGLIVKSEKPGRNSNRPSLHSSPRTVWKSLVYVP
jgi:hypothetical protein